MKIKLRSKKKEFDQNTKWEKILVRWIEWTNWRISNQTHSWPICQRCLGWDDSFGREANISRKGNHHILVKNHWNRVVAKYKRMRKSLGR